MTLHRYWITFKRDDVGLLRSLGLGLGMGVTAFDEADMKRIVGEHLKDKGPVELEAIEADVKYDSLEANHVRKNMGNMADRGIWFPKVS